MLEHLLFLWNIETPFTVWRGGSLPGSDHRCASFESLSGPARFADSNRGSNRGPDSPDSDHYEDLLTEGPDPSFTGLDP